MERSHAGPVAKNVLRKLNNESLAAIERGLAGDLPIRLRTEKHKVRGYEQQIVPKHQTGLGLISGCFPTSGSHPNLAESMNRLNDIVSREEISPLKKTFSFKDNFGRLFRQNAPRAEKKEPESTENQLTSNDTKLKKFWPFKSKETTEIQDTGQQKTTFKGNKLTPIYVRSKSFEFLPRAMESEEDLHGNFKQIEEDPMLKRKTMCFDSDERLSNSLEELAMQHGSRVSTNKPDLLDHEYLSDKRSTSASSLSSEGGIEVLLRSDSVKNVLDEFENTVRLCEDYASDSELCVTRKRVSKEVFRNRKSSSFSALPSPKVVKVNSIKPSKLTDKFNWELNSVILGQRVVRDTGMGLIRENLAGNMNKRQSVTQWNVIDDIDRLQSRMAAKKSAADRKRIRRTSSTNYWITGEDARVFAREHRPPYVIPRVRVAPPTSPPRSNKTINDVVSSHSTSSSGSQQQSLRDVRRIFEGASPDLHKGSESPPVNRFNNRLGGSNEMLSKRRSTAIHSASGSGDSLDSRSDLDVARPKTDRSKSIHTSKNLTLALKPNFAKVLPSLTEPTNARIMEGNVQRAKIAENGKKVKKNWSPSYAVLNPNTLALYKDQKAYQQAKNLSSAGTPTTSVPDIVLLNDAVVARCMPQHTSKYVRSFIVTSGTRDQILLQTETPANSVAWYEAVVNAINKLPNDYECPNYSDIHIDDPKTTPSPTSKHRRPKNKVGDSSNEDLSDPAEYSNVRSKLKKFFTKRPSMESLVRKGIYKDEPVFGRCLEEVCSPRSPRVPEFVMRCIRAIEASPEHMQADGLYRASGNLSQVQKIRLEVDQNNLNILDSSVDVHVLTGSLKLFFRELKDPLIPTKYFDQILTASMNQNRASRIHEFQEIVKSLPLCNRDTLNFLLEHLLRVTSHSSHNRMSVNNLAIVFGPTLLWAPAHLAHNLAADSFRQNLVVETLLKYKAEIFGDYSSVHKS